VFIRTEPREIAARWIKPGDEVATYEVENGSGDTDSHVRAFIRTTEYAARFSTPDWLLVIDGPHLVPPPADEEVNRVEGVVQHDAGGQFTVDERSRGFVPDGLDHTGAVSFVVVPINNNRVGEPRVYFAKDTEQFVIRERVKVPTRTMYQITSGKVPAEIEGQRTRAGFTITAVTDRCPNDWHTSAPARAHIMCPECPSSDAPTMLADAFGWTRSDAPDYGGEDDVTTLALPENVDGQALGRVLAEASIGDYTRENTEQ
jgi:hypothetical protein